MQLLYSELKEFIEFIPCSISAFIGHHHSQFKCMKTLCRFSELLSGVQGTKEHGHKINGNKETKGK